MLGGAGGRKDIVYVRLANNTTRGIPAWMFDEAICASVRSADRPIIDCQALLRLTRLLDSACSESRSAGHERTTSSPQNPVAESQPAAAPSTRSRALKAKHPTRDADQVPPSVAGDAQSGRPQEQP